MPACRYVDENYSAAKRLAGVAREVNPGGAYNAYASANSALYQFRQIIKFFMDILYELKNFSYFREVR